MSVDGHPCYLTDVEIAALLSAPDRGSWKATKTLDPRAPTCTPTSNSSNVPSTEPRHWTLDEVDTDQTIASLPSWRRCNNADLAGRFARPSSRSHPDVGITTTSALRN